MGVDSWLPGLLKAAIMVAAVVALTVVSKATVRRPHRHRSIRTRRRLTRVLPVTGLLIAGCGALIGLVGTTEDADPANGRAMMIAGTAMVVGGLLLVVPYLTVFVEATPTGFIARTSLGRRRAVAYGDIVDVRERRQNGMLFVDVLGRDGTRISGSAAMYEWGPFDAWKRASAPR